MDQAVTLDGMIPDTLRVVTGHILIDSLEVLADIGFHEFEVGQPQRLHVTVELWTDDALAAPHEDDPEAAWDYDFIVTEVRRMATERRYNLQETLVHAIFDRLAAARGVRALRIRSMKPDVYPDARGVGIELASFHGATP